jgi:hypothetical protein
MRVESGLMARRNAPLFRGLEHPVPAGAIVLAVAALMLAALLIVPLFYRFEGTLSDFPFRFGWAIEAVARTGSLMACSPPPIHDNYCTFASRMPLLPYFYAGAAKLAGDSLLRIALAKTLLFDLLLLFFVARFIRFIGPDRAVAAVLIALFAGPQFMLHSVSPYYEEGFIIPLLGILFVIQLSYALGRERELPSWARLPAYVAVSAGLYLLKSTLLVVLAWNLIFLLAFVRLAATRKTIVVAALCAAPLAWGAVVDHVTGRFALGTSIDGLNLLRGNNPAALELYPRYTVDRTVGDGAVGIGGAEIPQFDPATMDPRFASNPWRSEWEIDDAYRAVALRWMSGHIGDVLRLTTRRLWIFFVEIRNTPAVPGAPKPAGPILALGMSWMLAMRLVMWSAIIAAFEGLRHAGVQRRMALGLLGLLAAYAVPFVFAYAMERHVVPILLPCALYLLARWRLASLRINRLAALSA